jgi:hypothetical protein
LSVTSALETKTHVLRVLGLVLAATALLWTFRDTAPERVATLLRRVGGAGLLRVRLATEALAQTLGAVADLCWLNQLGHLLLVLAIASICRGEGYRLAVAGPMYGGVTTSTLGVGETKAALALAILPASAGVS